MRIRHRYLLLTRIGCDHTVENLREISPTGFGCVPGVYNFLAEALERDADFRHKFFKNLRWMS